MDVREKLVEQLRKVANLTPPICMYDHPKEIEIFGKKITVYCKPFEQFQGLMCEAADYIANGVTVQEWIPVTNCLPEENEYVMIFDGLVHIAKIEKGISKQERELMKNGEINDPIEIGWNMSDGYFQLKRSESYRSCDECWNNSVPYCWHVNGGMCNILGQKVTHWMPLPEPPKGE